jgi:co-chaperonin GroES (HSP10)
MVEPTALEQKRAEKIEQEAATDIVLDEHIPRPVGYQVLIALPEVEEAFSNSKLVKSNKTIRDEQILSMVGLVVDMGDQAYRDVDRYPTGPWCKQGDYVLFRANTGTRFLVGKKEMRLMNDDSIQAVVNNPNAIKRV